MRRAVLLCLLAGAAGALAQEGDVPDLELLEYLGSWQENDEEWLVVAEWQKRERRGRQRPEEQADGNDE